MSAWDEVKCFAFFQTTQLDDKNAKFAVYEAFASPLERLFEIRASSTLLRAVK